MWYPTNKSSIAVAKIAERDIPIIKVGISSTTSDTFMSYFRHACYELNRPVRQIKIEPLGKFELIAEGYHFFKSNMITVNTNELYSHSYTFPYMEVRSRFTSEITHFYPKQIVPNHLVIVKGFIPKGTIYYLNADGEGVAERIVLTEMTEV